MTSPLEGMTFGDDNAGRDHRNPKPSSPFRDILNTHEKNVIDELSQNIGVFTSGTTEGTVARAATKQLVDFLIKPIRDPRDLTKIIGHQVEYGRVSLNAIPYKEILCNKDPLTESISYTLTLQTKEDDILPEPVGPYTLSELISALEDRHLAWKTGTVFQERIRHLIAAYHADGQIKYTHEIQTGGFYCLDGKTITPSKVEVKLPTKKEVQESCWFITEVQKRFYSKARDTLRFSHLLNLTSFAPFDFARRQMEGVIERHGYGQSIDAYGQSHTGKSTMQRRICLEMWRKNDKSHFIESNSTTNESRVAGALRDDDTYPKIFDELDYLVFFESKDYAQKVISGLKNSRESTDFRTIRGAGKNKQGGIKQLALSLPLITRNTGRISEAGFNSRFISDEHKQDDVKTPEMEKAFNDFMDSHVSKYGHAGDFIAHYVVNHPEVLNQKWTDISKKLLQELFAYAEIPYPNWLDQTLENTTNANIAEEHISIIRATFNELIDRAWTANRSDPEVYKAARLCNPTSEDPLCYLKQVDRFIALVNTHHLPHFDITMKGKVVIHSSIDVLLKGKGVNKSQEAIADLCGFVYNTQRVGEGSPKVINTPIENFDHFLSPTVEEIDGNPGAENKCGDNTGGSPGMENVTNIEVERDSIEKQAVLATTIIDKSKANEGNEKMESLTCPICKKFQNYYSETIEHHIIHDHGKKDIELLRNMENDLTDSKVVDQLLIAFPNRYTEDLAVKIVKEYSRSD